MKKIICILIAVIMSLGMFSVCAAALNEVTYGSVNGDKEVKSDDARLILRASVGLEKFGISELKAADLDYDGNISSADARLCLRMSVGLTVTKPVSDVNILLHGKSYYVSCKMTNESGTVPFASAKSGDNFVFGISSKDDTFSYIKKDGGYFIAYNKSIVPMTKSVMKLIGIDTEAANLDSILGIGSSVFENMLKGYESSKTIIEVDNKMIPRNKTVIAGTAGAYTVVYETIDGQLMSVETFTSHGTSISRFDFDITTCFVPDGMLNTDSFRQSDILTMMLNIYNNKEFMSVLDKLNPKK